MSLNPDDHELNSKLTALYTSKEYARCFDACQEKLKKNPLNLQALLYMSHITLERRDLDDCLHYCDTINRGVDDRIYYVWCWRGQALMLKKNYDEAIKNFEQAIKYNPAHRDTWSYLALTFFMQGKKDTAIILLDKVESKIEELRGQFTIARGYIERANGNKAEALFQFLQGSLSFDTKAKDSEESKAVFAREIRRTLDKD